MQFQIAVTRVLPSARVIAPEQVSTAMHPIFGRTKHVHKVAVADEPKFHQNRSDE